MRPLSDQQAAVRNVLEADLDDDDDDDEVTITPNRRKKGTSKENADPNTLADDGKGDERASKNRPIRKKSVSPSVLTSGQQQTTPRSSSRRKQALVAREGGTDGDEGQTSAPSTPKSGRSRATTKSASSKFIEAVDSNSSPSTSSVSRSGRSTPSRSQNSSPAIGRVTKPAKPTVKSVAKVVVTPGTKQRAEQHGKSNRKGLGSPEVEGGADVSAKRSRKETPKAKGKTKSVAEQDSTSSSRKPEAEKVSASPKLVKKMTPQVEGSPRSKGGRVRKQPTQIEESSAKTSVKKQTPGAAVESPKVVPKKRQSIASKLQIDMVSTAFQPDTPKRKRRSPAKLLYDLDSSPEFMPVGKKNSGRTASKAEDSKTLPKKANTAPPKPKLKVSTLKNYESDPEDKDITSEEDSDVYQSGQEEESDSSDGPTQSDEDLDDLESSGKKKKVMVRKSKAKKSKGAAKDKPARKAAVSKAKRVMTPRVPSRQVPLPDVVSPLQEAQLRLHVGAVPDSLPCREDEFAEIFTFTEGKIQEGIGGCMYISGLPGTGKTATVKEVIRTLEEDKSAGGLPDFRFIEVNGMRLTEPNQAYVQIWQGLTGGEKCTAEHARNLLEKRFTSADKKSGKKTVTTVLVVDELDMLWNKKQSVLYNIFEWPTYKWAKLVVLAIANTMDLPERVMINRVSSRIGLTRLNFSPYTHEQLTEIVAARLHGLSVFDRDAVNLVARKVSSLSGDARRALDICRRATEIAQRHQERKKAEASHEAAANKVKKSGAKKSASYHHEDEAESESVVGMIHVTQAHKEMFCSPKMMAIRCCSPFEKMFLQTLVAIFAKTGIEETSLGRAHELLSELALVEGYGALSTTRAHSVAGRLIGMRLVLGEPGKSGRLDMKVRLNVSTDDVNFALKKDYA